MREKVAPQPQENKHVQGRRAKLPDDAGEHQPENPDRGQQGAKRQPNNPDIERNFEDQAR